MDSPHARRCAILLPLSQRPSRWPLHHALHAFLRIHDPEVLDDLESAALRLGDVHVHPEVMLAGHHFSWAARPLRDLCVIQCFDDVVLLQRAGLFDGSLPEPRTAVHARSCTASRELGAARMPQMRQRSHTPLLVDPRNSLSVRHASGGIETPRILIGERGCFSVIEGQALQTGGQRD